MLVPTILLLFLAILLRLLLPLYRIIHGLPKLQKDTVAFFHPFADGGGGGERVLWCAVKALQDAYPKVKVVIYVRQGPTVDQLTKDSKERFNIAIPRPFELVHLAGSDLILPEKYPKFTLLGQAWGSAKLGHEALSKLVPEVFIDTTGWAFTFPLARLAGSRVACYVHYPTVSTDMIGRVRSQESSFNNDAAISGSLLKSAAKLVYYNLFALLYGAVGACSQVTMTNSSWTRRHIAHLWWGWHQPDLVYPPCDTSELQKLPLDRRLKRLYLISVAQFRPEKNHRLQLEAFSMTKQRAISEPPAHALRVARLLMVGSCRNEADKQRLEQLQQYAQELGVQDDVDWHVNVSFSELQELLGDAVGGLHTMRDEHFGISVVEYMAAGCIPIAHNSAGPKEDIVVPQPSDEEGEFAEQRTGYLATTVEEYADAMREVLEMSQVDRLKIAAAAQKHASRFSGERFMTDFVASVRPLLPS